MILDHFTTLLLGGIIIILLYTLVLMNGRQFRYFKSILDDERHQNATLADFFNSLRPTGAPPSTPNPIKENNRVLHRSDRIEKEIEELM